MSSGPEETDEKKVKIQHKPLSTHFRDTMEAQREGNKQIS